MKTYLPAGILVIVLGLLWALVPWANVFVWATDAQRVFQENMARALSAIRTGDMSVVWALCTATAAYGFVHALGPGHGKILLGGAAFATGATLRRMTLLTLISSLAQAGTAIVLVGVFAVLAGMSSRQLGAIADNWLAPASYIAIASLGAYLVWRGLRQLRALKSSENRKAHQDSDHEHRADGSCCGHAHGPSIADVKSLGNLRDSIFLVVSIALRPCTGAIFVLVIALRFDVFWIGCLAVVTMGLGTASFNLLVAWSGVAARHLSALQSEGQINVARAAASLQMVGGVTIAALSLMWLLHFWV